MWDIQNGLGYNLETLFLDRLNRVFFLFTSYLTQSILKQH